MTATIWSGGGWRFVGWGAAAFLLLLPLLTRAPWTLSDYVAMGGLLGSAGLLLELAVRTSQSLVYRAAAAVAAQRRFFSPGSTSPSISSGWSSWLCWQLLRPVRSLPACVPTEWREQ